MKTRFLTLVAGTLLVSGAAFAQQAALPPIPDNAPIYGSQLMTTQERGEHQVRMRTARTMEEREQIRAEHHRKMAERARERGVSLPEVPPARGAMMGPRGAGMGPEAGPGAGAGPRGGVGQRGAMGQPRGGMGQRGGMGPGGAR